MNQSTLAASATSAFAQADWTGARAQFEQLAAAGAADGESLAKLAFACMQLNDAPAAHAAAEQALKHDGRNLRAVIVKADLLTAEGNPRAANFYNGLTLEIGGPIAGLAPELAAGVARARSARAYVHNNMLNLLQDELRAAGYSERSSSRRFTLALDVLTGRKQPYFQQPTRFYYPELPNLQFFPREQFPWLDRVEAATDAITEELRGVMADEATFSPYLRQMPNIPKSADPLVDSLDWSTCPILFGGKPTPVAQLCPATLDALSDAPMPRIPESSPDVLFSQFKAGAHILPHTGATNTRLICHVPLIVPPDCLFRVGNETRQWEKGKAWVFDDTIDHEAWNRSGQTRIILMFDIWRPELDEEERALISTLFGAMYAYAPDRAVSSL